MHHGPDRHALLQQLSSDCAADPAGGAGHQNAITHRTTLSVSRAGSLAGSSQPTTIAAPSATPAHTSVLTCKPSRNARSTAARTKLARCGGSCAITWCATAIDFRIESAGSPANMDAALSRPEYTE